MLSTDHVALQNITAISDPMVTLPQHVATTPVPERWLQRTPTSGDDSSCWSHSYNVLTQRTDPGIVFRHFIPTQLAQFSSRSLLHFARGQFEGTGGLTLS